MMRQGVTIFAGDVGGTKVHLGLYSFAEGKLEHIRDRQFPAKEFSSLEEIAKQFLGADRPSLGCFGVTGPVRDGRLRLTQKYNGRVSYDRVISGSGLTNFFEFCATSAAWKRRLGSGNGFLRRLLTLAFLNWLSRARVRSAKKRWTCCLGLRGQSRQFGSQDAVGRTTLCRRRNRTSYLGKAQGRHFYESLHRERSPH